MKKSVITSSKMHQNGFTLIELMIVIGIIAILAVVAIPQYTSYIARSQLTEAINVLGGARLAATDDAATNGFLTYNLARMSSVYPTVNADGTVNGAKYVERIDIHTMTNGDYALSASFKATGVSSLLGQRHIRLSTPASGQSGSGSSWKCATYVGIPRDAVPTSCRASYSSVYDPS